MLERRTFATVGLSGVLLGAMLGAPAHAGVAGAGQTDAVLAGVSNGAGPSEQPLTVIALTDDDGERTPAAVVGIEELEGQVRSGISSAASAGGSRWEQQLRAFGGGAGVATGRFMLVPGGSPALHDVAGVAALTPPMETDEFFVAGVTWDGTPELPDGVRVFLRVQEGGEWSDWSEAPVEDGADDGEGGGTEPYLTGGAEAVQVQISGDEAALPPNLRVNLVPAVPAPAEKVVTEPNEAPLAPPTEDPVVPDDLLADTVETVAWTASSPAAQVVPAARVVPAAQVVTAAQVVPAARVSTAAAASLEVPPAVVGASLEVPPTTVGRPDVISRAGWKADEALMTWTPRYAELKAAVVHHTAGTNNYTAAESASIVRGIYYYHAVTRDWGDIGYNFLVDKYGQVFEGRRGSLAAANGVMPVGAHAAPFNTGTLGISAMGDYTKVDAPQIILDRMAEMISWAFARAGVDMSTASGMISPGTPALPAGQKLARIFGHREVSSTACPGPDIYGRIPALIESVKERLPQLFLLNNAWDTSADVTFRYGERDAEVFVGDWDGDGLDTVATRIGNVFSVTNANAYGEPDIVLAYGRPGDVILVGDWDGNGTDTLAVRRGAEYHVRNDLSSGPADEIVMYGRTGDQVLVGDWDGNGTDSLAVRRGTEFFIKNTIAIGSADYVVVYGREGDDVLVGDWSGNGTDTLAVRRGAQYHIKNSLTAGKADIEVVYGRAEDRVLVGDWNGDRTDTLGVRRS